MIGVFWSPDSAHIGFFADGKLKRAPVGGGPIQKICDATLPSGGTWGKDDVIVFAAGANEGLSRVAAAGGQPTVITTVDASKKENSHRWPAFLPDGRHFLYLARNINVDNSVVYAASLDDPAHPTEVLVTPSSALFAPPGYLLFVRERSLMAQPFDPGALRTTGDAFPVAENVGASTTRVLLGAFSVSDTGVLAYGTGTSPSRQYAWFDRAGKELSRIAPIGQFTDIVLAPDGTRAAVRQDVAGNADIWILDLIRGVPSRLTFDAAVDWFPVWSADGKQLAVGAEENDRTMLPDLDRPQEASDARASEIHGDHADQALAFPWIGDFACRLVRGHADGDSAGELHFFNFDVAVAESKQLRAVDAGHPGEALNQHALGKGGEVIQRAEDAAIEVACDVQQIGLLLYVDLVGAAGQAERESAAAQRFQNLARPGHQVFIRRAVTLAKLQQAVANHGVEALQVLALIGQRVQGRAPAARDFIGERDHLVKRLLAGEAPDVILHHGA
jgi:hypothetical protein